MIRSRIAPTPSGYLHIGNAMNFVLTWLMVRSAGGGLRLRIDDIDAPRAKPDYVADIFRTLEWMGLDWDEGPQSVDGQMKIYSQSLRSARYEEVIQQLIRTRKVFACKCSRKEMDDCMCKEQDITLDAPGTALRINTLNEAVVVHDSRMGVQEIYLNKDMKDFVIRRKDGIASYQVASLADDIDFGVNLIVRGADLLPSTAAQWYLAQLMGADFFSQTAFYHHPLISDGQGYKLSKSAGSLSLKAMRERDSSPARLYAALSSMLGFTEIYTSLSDMLAAYPPKE